MNPKLAHRYVEDGMATIPKPQLVLRLYERLQLDLDRAVEALAVVDVEAAHNALIHAQDIVHELNLALDIDRWADGRTLRSIYQHVTGLLIEANTTKNPAPVHQAAELVRPLCDAWREAIALAAAETTPVGPVTGAYGAAADAAPARTQVVG